MLRIDGEIDYSDHSVEQLKAVLAGMDRATYPRNWANATRTLQAMRAGTTPGARFAVRLRPLVSPLILQPVTNTFGLVGAGELELQADQIVVRASERLLFGIKRAASVTIMLADLANCEYVPEHHAISLVARDGTFQLTIWSVDAADLESIWRAVPQDRTAAFTPAVAESLRFQAQVAEVAPTARVTPLLIAVNVAVFALMAYFGAGVLKPNPAVHLQFGSNFGPQTWTGEPWRLLGSTFLHYGVVHLAMNMWALYMGGSLTERLFGSGRFALLYLSAGVAGSVASGWWHPLVNSAGASGAIFGVYGGLIAYLLRWRGELLLSIVSSQRNSALLFCAYSLFNGATHTGVDNAAHVGGLLAGFAAGWLLARPFERAARSTLAPRQLVAAMLVIAVPLAGLAWPLAAPPAARHQSLQLTRDLQGFVAAEKRAVDAIQPIATAMSQSRPTSAAAERLMAARFATDLRRQALPPAQALVDYLHALPVPTAAGSRAARLHAVLAEYAEQRLLGTQSMIEMLETPDERAQAASERAWARVNQLISEIRAIGQEPV